MKKFIWSEVAGLQRAIYPKNFFCGKVESAVHSYFVRTVVLEITEDFQKIIGGGPILVHFFSLLL